jgi:hypothetical protein
MKHVQTRKFFVVDGEASDEFRQVVENSDAPLPPSYIEFVLRFGNAKLFRKNNYLLTVHAGPRVTTDQDGDRLYCFGRASMSWAYFRDSLLLRGSETPVFEWRHRQGLRKTYDGFEEWLEAKWKSARRQFRSKEWQAIEAGPPPFTECEKAVVTARRKYSWRFLGIATNGDLRFEVHNGSDTVLPYLTLGIRYKGGDAFGGVKLPIADLNPGSKKLVEIDCYKKWHDPSTVEPFEEGDPEPEDRDRYWEFK